MWKSVLVAAMCLLFPMSSSQAQNEESSRKALEAASQEDFEGVGFGVGVGLSIDLADGDAVQRAEVIGGKLRVLEQKSYIPRLLLECHYFFLPGSGFFGLVEEGAWGVGPFVAIQSGSNDVIETLGAGLMMGFRRTEMVTKGRDNQVEQVRTNSFNVGLGFVLDGKASVLRDGVKENEAPPPGEEGALLKETSRWGLLIAFSFMF
jgi:hypothetical protein